MRASPRVGLALAMLTAANIATAQVSGPFDYLRIDDLGHAGPNGLVTDLSHTTADFLNEGYLNLMQQRGASSLHPQGDMLDRIFSDSDNPFSAFESPGAPRENRNLFSERTISQRSSRPFSFLSSGSGDHVVHLRDRSSSGNTAIPRISNAVGPEPPSGLTGAYVESPLLR